MRLRQLRSHWDLTQTELAQKVEVTLTAWQNYELGRNTPGGVVLGRLVKLRANANWILNGIEPMLLVEPEPKPGDTRDEESMDGNELIRRRRERILEALGLLPLLEVCQVGHIAQEWEITTFLRRRYPGLVTYPEIRQHLERSGLPLDDSLLKDLLEVLKRKKVMVERMKGATRRFSATADQGSLTARDLPDYAQTALLAIQALARDIVPRTESRQETGRIFSGRFSIDPARAREASNALYALIQGWSQEYMDASSTAEAIVVAGFGVVRRPE